MADVERSTDEIEHEASEAGAIVADGNDHQWGSMSYEQGVRDALDWVLGERDESPLSEHPEYQAPR